MIEYRLLRKKQQTRKNKKFEKLEKKCLTNKNKYGKIIKSLLSDKNGH